MCTVHALYASFFGNVIAIYLHAKQHGFAGAGRVTCIRASRLCIIHALYASSEQRIFEIVTAQCWHAEPHGFAEAGLFLCMQPNITIEAKF